MKKILNRKGFTLVELLAVIVVLAIIMVIATQAIGDVIEKNTVSSFESSLNLVAKQAKQAYSMKAESTTKDDVVALVEFDSNQYTISYETGTKQVCLVSVANGKFHKMKKDLIKDKTGWTQDDSGVTTACKTFK